MVKQLLCSNQYKSNDTLALLPSLYMCNWSKIAKNSDLLPFKKNKDSLSVDENVLLLHRDCLSRVVIPSVLQLKVLQLLHETH